MGGLPVNLFSEPLESVRQLRAAFSLVGELRDEQRERLGVPGDPERTGVHRIEARVAYQAGGHFLAATVVATVHEARPVRLALRFVDTEQHFTGHGVERAYDAGLRNFL